MSREQGPRFAGTRPAAIAAGRRQWPHMRLDKLTEAA